MKLFGLVGAVNAQGDGDHLRLVAEASQDAGVPVLDERADLFGGVNDLEGVQRRRHRGQHARLGHGNINGAKLQYRMSAGEKAFGIDVGHGAGRGDVHVAAHQDHADRRPGLDRFGLLLVGNRTGAHDRRHARRRELRGEALHGVFGETGKYQRRLDGSKQVRESRNAGTAGAGGVAFRFGNHRLRVGRLGLVQRVNLEHLLDRGHAADRLLGEIADTEGECAHQFAVNVNRAAAHAGDHARVFGLLPAEAHQDDVALGAVDVAHDAQDLDVHRLRLHTLEYGVGDAFHARLDFAQGHDFLD